MAVRTAKDINKEIELMRKFAETYSSDKGKALDFLCQIGVTTRTGKITKRYR